MPPGTWQSLETLSVLSYFPLEDLSVGDSLSFFEVFSLAKFFCVSDTSADMTIVLKTYVQIKALAHKGTSRFGMHRLFLLLLRWQF